MRNIRSIKFRATIWASAVMAVSGVIACFFFVMFESYSIKREFIQGNKSASSTLVRLVSRDVALGNYYNFRNRLLEFSNNHNLSGLVYCANSGEKLLIVDSQSNLCNVGIDSPVFDGNSYIMPIIVGIDGVDWGRLVLAYSTESMFDEIARTRRYTIIGFLGVLLCIEILLYFIIHKILSPIAKYIDWLGRISERDNLYEVETTANTVFKSNEEKCLHNAFFTVLAKYRQLHSNLQEQVILASLGSQATAVAHDIRSPLSSLKAAADMLGRHVAGNEDAMDAVNLLQLSSSRLEGIANGLLARHTGAEAVAQVFSIHEVLDELVGELQASPIGHGVEFKKQYHTDALYVSGDKTGMARAVGNIIKNALEAMQGNPEVRGKKLMVSTSCTSPSPGLRPTSPTRGEVIIKITDTGPGIPTEKIPLILQGGHTEGKENGHGIGTKVVKEVVEAHKGQLNIESEVGKGTTFIITLPLTPPIEGGMDGMTVTIPYSGTGTIYVIDDEASMREQWRLTFKGFGIAAQVFACWEEYDSVPSPHPSPLPQGEREQPTTFIIDYQFNNSRVDGVEIVRRLKARGFDNLVLATAEYWKPAIKAAAMEFGVVLCPKPLPKVVLHAPPPPQSNPIYSGGPELNNTAGSPLPGSPTGIQCGDDDGAPSVLLIDDDTGIHWSWKTMKKILGVGTLTMHSSIEEMIAAATNPAHFDLCVIDKNIEGSKFDGARTLEYLRQNGARTVVLATGDGEDAIRKDPRFNSADGILKGKVPMTPEELDPFLN